MLGYAAFVTFLGAIVASRAVYARVAEGSLQAGREMEQLADFLGSTKTIFLNGAAMNVSTALTDQTPAQVLDRFEDLCRSHPQFLARALADIPSAFLEKAHVVQQRLWRLGVLRRESGDEGALICFTDDRPISWSDAMTRLRAFGDSKDLAEFGRLRYVYVKATKGGSHVRTIWTEGPFKLGEMFPAHGDAAGFDSATMPRPPGATRILSVTSAQVPYAVHVYRSSETKESLFRFFDQEMSARGWTVVSTPTQTQSPGARGYLKKGVMSLVALKTKGASTLVTTTETAGQGDGDGEGDGHGHGHETKARVEVQLAQ